LDYFEFAIGERGRSLYLYINVMVNEELTVKQNYYLPRSNVVINALLTLERNKTYGGGKL